MKNNVRLTLNMTSRIFWVLLALTASVLAYDLPICDDLPRFPEDYEVYINFTVIELPGSNGSQTRYRLDASVDWSSLNTTAIDQFDRVSGYAVRMGINVTKSIRPNLDCPSLLAGYDYTNASRYTFQNLLFGYTYTFLISTANITANKTEWYEREIRITTPDCYEETKDEAFCLTQPVELSSRPRDLRVDCVSTDAHNRTTAFISWLAPLQRNGNLTRFTVMNSGHENTWNGNLTVRFHSNVSLDVGSVNEIIVTPFILIENRANGEEKGVYNFDARIRLNASDPTSLEDEYPRNNTNAELCRIPPLPPGGTTGSKRQGEVNSAMITGLLFAIGVVLIAVIIVLIIVNRRRFRSNEKATFVRYPDEISTTYSCSIKKDSIIHHHGREVDPVFQKIEFDRSMLKIEENLGSGQFGTVYKGFAFGIDGKEKYIPVAVKSLKENATRAMKDDFLDEIKLIIEIGNHPNILPILGCCTTEEPYYLITELMVYGDLLHFLWKCREEKNIIDDPIYKLTPTGQLQIAIQIARGMEYLASTLYYHGDLAARNVLVGNGLICKISDFGLADDIYQRGYKRLAPERKRPVKWVSLETNTQGKCSIQSDVWSFGIVLYEIYTLGGVPYPGIDGLTVIPKLQRGYRMERPSTCPQDIYDIARACWHESPHHRPTFTVLYNQLDAMLTNNVDYLTELETDLMNYDFVPCQERDTGSSAEESKTTGNGDCRIQLSAISNDLQHGYDGKDCKFENAGFSSSL